jgi:hypothetical protein
MGVAHTVFQKFVYKVSKIVTEKKVKEFRLFTSIDSWGQRAEYIRNGLDCALWEQNMRFYLDNIPESRINFMCTFNILSVTSFHLLLEKILIWRKEYCATDAAGYIKRINFDVPYLKEPPHWMINILPKEFIIYMDNNLEFMKKNKQSTELPEGFDEVEIQKFSRLKIYMETHQIKEELIIQGRRDFYSFFTEHDRRRDTSFTKTFPDYIDFLNLCKGVYLDYEKNKGL